MSKPLTDAELMNPKTGVYRDTKTMQLVALAYDDAGNVRELGRCSIAIDPQAIAWWECEVWKQSLATPADPPKEKPCPFWDTDCHHSVTWFGKHVPKCPKA